MPAEFQKNCLFSSVALLSASLGWYYGMKGGGSNSASETIKGTFQRDYTTFSFLLGLEQMQNSGLNFEHFQLNLVLDLDEVLSSISVFPRTDP